MKSVFSVADLSSGLTGLNGLFGVGVVMFPPDVVVIEFAIGLLPVAGDEVGAAAFDAVLSADASGVITFFNIATGMTSLVKFE